MNTRVRLAIGLGLVLAGLLLACCQQPEPCTSTATGPLTAYRKPSNASEVFGQVFAGESLKVMAQTTEGWIGFDPAIAQAGNIGWARPRWVLASATFTPSCLDTVETVTLAEVEADIAASQN